MEVAELLSDVGIEVAIVRCKKWDDHLLQCQAFLGASKTGRLSVGKPVWIYMTKPSSSNHFWRMEKAVEKWVVWWGRGKAQWAKVDAEDLQLHAPRVMFFFSIPTIWKKSRHMAARTESRSGSAFISAYSEAAVERSCLTSAEFAMMFSDVTEHSKIKKL